MYNIKKKINENSIDENILKNRIRYIINETMQNVNIENEKTKIESRAKKTKLQNLMFLFNVHVDFHFSKIIKKYEIVINCNVFTKKIKHKYIFSISF